MNHPKNGKLIFDLGFYDGDTSRVYLNQGYRVIGVECNPQMVAANKSNFGTEISVKRLVLVDKCISDKNGDIIPFYVSKKDVWSSVHKGIAERKDKADVVEVGTITLPILIEIYGCPEYCKIDIEGNDIVALKSLHSTNERPKVISCETECAGKNGLDYNGQEFEVINELKSLGYTKFHLEKQPSNIFYDSIMDWADYKSIKKEISKKRHTDSYDFWYDVYATY